MESRYGVDLHIATRTEAETIFAGVGIRDGERLIHGVEFAGEVGHLDPHMFAIDSALHHKSRVFTTTVRTHERTEGVCFAFLGRERQHLAALYAQWRCHQIIIGTTATTHQFFDVETGCLVLRTVVLGLLFLALSLLGHSSTVNLPVFCKPAVRQFVVVETLIHLTR